MVNSVTKLELSLSKNCSVIEIVNLKQQVDNVNQHYVTDGYTQYTAACPYIYVACIMVLPLFSFFPVFSPLAHRCWVHHGFSVKMVQLTHFIVAELIADALLVLLYIHNTV